MQLPAYGAYHFSQTHLFPSKQRSLSVFELCVSRTPLSYIHFSFQNSNDKPRKDEFLPFYFFRSSPGLGSITSASGSQTESPFPPTSTATVSPRPSYGAAALTTDPLMQYINSRVSLVSHSSRGPLAAWELPFSEFQILRPIGEGSWGRCYSANWNETQVAVKVLLDGNVENAQSSTPATQSALLQSNSPVFARLVQEASLMTQLHSPYIVQFLGMTTDPAALVTEYCSRGSLNFILQAANANPAKAAELTWTRRISMAADAVRGCLYLHNHSPPIIHRDLKSANLLITQAWTCKVADFNLSKVIEQTSRSTSLQAMNPRWLAPEVLEGGQASMASDVFAFGVIFWELLTWKLPWGTSNPWGIVSAVINNGRLEIPEPSDLPGPGSGNWPLLDRYIALMRRCWSQNPGDRPRFEEVMAELRNLDPQAIGA
jgi:serine/threonine protein kinase